MCGIYGSIGFSPERERIDRVAHRGPDGAGWLEFASSSGPVALGHRRLAIFDTSEAALQPMADASRRYTIVLNGEIYNYIELRDELAAKGHVFTTQSDTEVLLAAYAQWNEKCLPKLLGMFAFLIWDNVEKKLFAARDRFGIKPLYVAALPQGVAFASEIKQLLGLPGLQNRMNLPRVKDFLGAGLSDHTGETLFRGVAQLPAGTCLAIDTVLHWCGRIAPKRWYDIPPHEGLRLKEREAAEHFQALLSDSVRLHLRSDVPLGSCLSGGLDSSSIVGLMSGMGASVRTIGACYEDRSVDEKPFMDAVIAKTGAEAHFVFPRAEDVFAKASDITWHQDEPFGSTSIFAQYCVFEEARRNGIKVMLDGQGADEQLAGYHSAYGLYTASLARKMRLIALARTMIGRKALQGASLSGQAARLMAPLLPDSVRDFALNRRMARRHHWLCSEAFGSETVSAFETARAANDLPEAGDIASLCLNMTFASNLPMLLHWEDRSSMAHGIEARVPFLDHRLVEFSLALGNDHKIVGADTKRVLRRAMKDVLPERVLKRRDKIGFATPEEAWFRGPLKTAIQEGVETTLRRFPGLLDAKGTRALAADMLEGRRKVDFTLWRIVNLGIWGERFGVSA